MIDLPGVEGWGLCLFQKNACGVSALEDLAVEINLGVGILKFVDEREREKWRSAVSFPVAEGLKLSGLRELEQAAIDELREMDWLMKKWRWWWWWSQIQLKCSAYINKSKLDSRYI